MTLVRIYRIENKINNLIYIGSTVQLLYKRMANHRNDANKGYQTNLHRAMRHLGYHNFYIILIKEIQCTDLDIARLEEQVEINRYDEKILLNENAALDSNAYKREYRKRFYQQNKERLCAYQRQYNREHYYE
jgi:GIY-YIG catalytic domain